MTARLLRQLVLAAAVASVTSLVGCVGEIEEDEASGSEALSGRVLRASECPIRARNQSDVAGVFEAPLSGCFLARDGESGDAMIARAIQIISNPSEIGSATYPDGTKMFASFRPGDVEGSLDAGDSLSYDARIGLDIVGPIDARGSLNFTSHRTAAGGISLRVTNTTNIGALGINPLRRNGLEFVLTLDPAQNGVIVTGSVSVTLVSQKDSVNQVSAIAPSIVSWLKKKLDAR
jgi:hypothetical protein